MAYTTFTASNGRTVELEVTAVNIRTPGKPLPRDFTCTAQLHEGRAFLKLGSAHTDANAKEVKRAVDEALSSLGVTDVDYEHNDKMVRYKVKQDRGNA